MADEPSTGDSQGTAPVTGTTQGNATDAPEWYKNPPEWMKPPENKPPVTNASGGNGPGQQLLEAIQALPEKILAGLKEASPKAQTAEQTAATTAPASGASATDAAPAGVNKPARDRFTDWWFKG